MTADLFQRGELPERDWKLAGEGAGLTLAQAQLIKKSLMVDASRL
jgi:hypothetical protein